MHRVRMLIHFGVTPYIVFDGDYLPSKAATEDGRAKRREESRQQGLKLYHAGKLSQAQQELQKAVDVTPEMAKQLIDELKRHKIQYVVAPYEADAQMAYLEREGIIQGIISEDSDLLVFGAKRLLTKLDQYGECVEINRSEFTACKAVSLVGWSDAEFRQMAILSGCDYLDNVDKIGLKTAYRLVRKYKKVERILQVAQFDGKFRVPDGYLDDFRKAELTFVHQRIYCPKQKKVIMASELTDTTFEDTSFLGKDVDEHIGRAVARGDLHPMTKQPLVNQASPLKHSPSPWGINSKKNVSTPSDSKPNKSIESFFKPRRVPLAELDPNSFTPSPSQRRVQEENSNTWFTSPLVESTGTPPVVATVPTTMRNRRSTSGRSVSGISSCPPSKRQRLCDDMPAVRPDSTPAVTTRSRFFDSQAPDPSPLVAKKNKKKDHDVHIFSDDSIEQALMDLPDVDGHSDKRTSKVSIFREGSSAACTLTPGLPKKILRTQDSVSTVTSFDNSQSQSAYNTQATSQASTTTLSRDSSSSSADLKDLLNSFTHNSTSNPPLAPKRSRIPLPKTPKAATRTSPAVPVPTGSTAVDSTKFFHDAAQEASSLQGDAENLTSPIAPPGYSPRVSRLADATSERIPESPQQVKSVIRGSEDYLIPNSEDELEPGSDDNDDTTSALPTVNLGRFLYSRS
jgi:exonuclease-1